MGMWPGFDPEEAKEVERRTRENNRLVGIGCGLILISLLMSLFKYLNSDRPMRGGKMIDGKRYYVAKPEGMPTWQFLKEREKDAKANKQKRVKKKRRQKTKVIDGKKYYLGHEERRLSDLWWGRK